MYIVVAGGGKLGEYLASAMLREGNHVAIIEENEAAAKRLSETIQGSVLVICGDGCEVSIQEDAGVPQADIFVAATGQDEDNLASCEIAARVFNVPRCIARVNSPKNLRIFRRLGIESVSATQIIARMIQEEAVLGSMSVALSMTSDEVGLLDIMVPRMRNHNNEEGVRALDIVFGEGIRAVAVSHGDQVEVVGEESRLVPGDHLIVAADTELIDHAREVIKAL